PITPRSSTAAPTCSPKYSARMASMPARPWAWARCPTTSRSRSRRFSRSAMREGGAPEWDSGGFVAAEGALDGGRRSANGIAVALEVGLRLLLGEDDRNGHGALARLVADRRGDAGDGKVRGAHLHREPLAEIGAGLLGEQLRIGFGKACGRRPGDGAEHVEPLAIGQMADKQPAGGGPVERHACADVRRDAEMPLTVAHRGDHHQLFV